MQIFEPSEINNKNLKLGYALRSLIILQKKPSGTLNANKLLKNDVINAGRLVKFPTARMINYVMSLP